MSRPRDDRQVDLFRPALEDIIDLGHPLVQLAAEVTQVTQEELQGRQVLPLRYLPGAQTEHWLYRGPVQVRHQGMQGTV